jgi:hypothetical protein
MLPVNSAYRVMSLYEIHTSYEESRLLVTKKEARVIRL